MDASDRRITCFVHIVNLTVQRVLSAISKSKPIATNVQDKDKAKAKAKAKAGDDDYVPDNDGDGDGVGDDNDGDDGDDDGGDDDDEDEDGLKPQPAKQTFKEAATRDPLGLARKPVRVLRSRCVAFRQSLVLGKERGYFDLEPLDLLRDVAMRWDSTYQMIGRLLYLQLASTVPCT